MYHQNLQQTNTTRRHENFAHPRRSINCFKHSNHTSTYVRPMLTKKYQNSATLFLSSQSIHACKSSTFADLTTITTKSSSQIILYSIQKHRDRQRKLEENDSFTIRFKQNHFVLSFWSTQAAVSC